MNEHAVGILVKDRPELTEKTLLSLFYADQQPTSYDLYIIDNGSTRRNLNSLKEWVASSVLRTKNLFCLSGYSIAQAWNLFLMATEDYSFRTLIDNDIVLYNTPITLKEPDPKVAMSSGIVSGGFGGVNPGAPKVASIVKSGDYYRPVGRTVQKVDNPTSFFLDQMKENSDEMGAGIVALVPVVPQVPFMNALHNAATLRFRDRPFLQGGCTMITHNAFSKLGYFDERLSRFVDRQYSQRALLQKINISYHPSYWAFHLGHDQPTSDQNTYQIEGRQSLQVIDGEPLTQEAVPSQWKKVYKKISAAARESMIVNLR